MSPPSSRHEHLSPQPSPRSSTRRRPLHERSPSLTNATSTQPTIRVVDDPGADNVYAKSPFPSEAAHLLPPRQSGAAFEDQGCNVSSPNPSATAPTRMLPGGSVADRIASFESIQSTTTLVPKPPQLHRSQRDSTASTRTSDADTFVDTPFTPSSSRFSQSTTPPSSPPPEENEKRDSLGSLAVLQEGKPLHTAPTIRPVIPSLSSIAEPRDPPDRKLSGSSIPSSSSSATPTLRHTEGDLQGSRSLDSNPPHPSPSHHTRASSWNSARCVQSTRKVPAELSQSQSRQTPSSSDDSLADLSIIPPPSSRSSERPRSATSPVHPTHAARTVTLEDGATLQYPLVRPPSASGSWVESRVLPKHPSRMTERSSNGHKWSSALSTIESATEPRTSQSLGSTSVLNSEEARRRQTLSSFVSSNIAEGPSSSEASVPIPRPLFSPRAARSPTAGRDSGEHGDTVGDLYSPPLRQQRSGNFRRWSVESSRPATAASNRSSYTVNVTNTLPEWTR
ncbi:hypothetical protein K490DRAFT_67438 [Saccharata proteae CBS 121410]|uniref:Uncharacterized protein n=1 Tax=Saccharata proteae CBS 121410 TaxID=1314787 RepID=A0A9P4HQ56_9PEZI|nr:hypothetical protein K490DRAFT_67438 [Saccharata proteae CBS 121410]